MITQILAKIFGTKNERELTRIQPLVARINELEQGMAQLTDEQLSLKTTFFRERLQVARQPLRAAELPRAPVFATMRTRTLPGCHWFCFRAYD